MLVVSFVDLRNQSCWRFVSRRPIATATTETTHSLRANDSYRCHSANPSLMLSFSGSLIACVSNLSDDLSMCFKSSVRPIHFVEMDVKKMNWKILVYRHVTLGAGSHTNPMCVWVFFLLCERTNHQHLAVWSISS